jgi:uncharacterized protein (TIRG00374 family)
MKRFRAGSFVKIALSLGILAYLAQAVDWTTLTAIIAGVDGWMFALAVVTMAGPIALTSIRWQVILRSQGIVLPVRQVIGFDLTGLFFNSVLPGSTGGDMVRAILAIRLFPNEKTRIVLSLVADRGTGLITLLLVAVLTLLFRPDIFAGSELLQSIVTFAIWVLLAAAAAFMILLGSHRARQSSLIDRMLKLLRRNAFASKLIGFVSPFLSKPFLVISLFAITFLSYGSNFLSGYFLAQALHLPLTFTQVVIMLAVVYVAISLPISMGGHGLRELVMVGMFLALGVVISNPHEAAIAYSVLLFAIQLIWSLVGGLFFLSYRNLLARSRLDLDEGADSRAPSL